MNEMLDDPVFLELFGRTPRDIGTPYRTLAKRFLDIQRFIEYNNGIHDCYIGTYSSNFLIDKIFFDFDYGSKTLEDSQKLYKWILDHDYRVIPIASGNLHRIGIHLHMFLKPKLYGAKTKFLLTKATYSILNQCFGDFKVERTTIKNKKVRIIRNEKRILGPDPVVIGDVSRLCVLPSTIMLGDNKPISDISIGDTTVGALNFENKVINKISRCYSGKMIRIKANGMLPFDITPEHPVLTVGGYDHWKKGILLKGNLEYKEAETLKEKHHHKHGDYLLIPIHKGIYDRDIIDMSPFIKRKSSGNIIRTNFPLNKDTAWLLGIYIAEGHMDGSHYDSHWSLGSHEKDLIQRIRKIIKVLGYSTSTSLKHENNSSTDILCCSSILARALESWCGKGALNKKIPDFIMFHDSEEIIKSFLDGYLAGDGCIYEPKNNECTVYSMATVSRTLALQVQILYARLRIFVHVNTKDGRSIICNKEVNCHKVYVMNYNFSEIHSHRYFDNFIATPVRKVEVIDYNGDVCNVETDDNTYLVSNVVVHNCRIPNTLRPPENNTWCAYLNYDKFLSMKNSDLFQHIRHSHSYSYNTNTTCDPLLTDFEYDLGKFEAEITDWKPLVSLSKNIPSNPCKFLKGILRPCLYKNIILIHPTHDVRVSTTIDLLRFGYTPEFILSIYASLSWEDYEPSKCLTQIKSCQQYHPYSCSKLRDLKIPEVCCVG